MSARLPGFAEGLFSVQDAGAQRAAELLDAQPGQRVLDACAAPGGKTGHILERCGGRARTHRAGQRPRASRARARQPRRAWATPRTWSPRTCIADGWWDGRPLRSHPARRAMFRHRRDPPPSRHQAAAPGRTTSAGFAVTQLQLLERCATLLKPGGRLVYATCSILPQKNQELVERFLRRHTGFKRTAADLQLLPQPRDGRRCATHRWLLLCLPRQGGRRPVRPRRMRFVSGLLAAAAAAAGGGAAARGRRHRGALGLNVERAAACSSSARAPSCPWTRTVRTRTGRRRPPSTSSWRPAGRETQPVLVRRERW